MPPVDRIVGPGVGPHDIELELPESWDPKAFEALANRIVLQCKRHCADTLRGMLHNTPGAAKLADEFAQKLGL